MSPSLLGRFPDPFFLISLPTEDLAGILFPYYRHLPFRQQSAVRLCIRRAVAVYPDTSTHAALEQALLDAWLWLDAQRLLDTDRDDQADVLVSVSIAIKR